MPGIARPAREASLEQLESLERQVRALQTQQNMVITDPTGKEGDAEHGHAVVVIGSLKTITGIAAYGIASYKTGSWVQL
jgi:hypothetical protein